MERGADKSLETRKNQNELLLQEDALMVLLQCEHLFTLSNSTLAARLFATGEGTLYRSYTGFFRPDVPSRPNMLETCRKVTPWPPTSSLNPLPHHDFAPLPK